MAPARAGLVRDTLGSLAVLGTVAFAAFGLPLIDRSLPDYRSVPANVPYPIGGGVTVQPPAYASIDLTRTRPGRDRGTVAFNVGGPKGAGPKGADTRLVVVVTPYHGSVPDAADRLRRKIIRTGGTPANDEADAAGGDGRLGSYVSDDRNGTYVVLLTGGRAVELTVTGPQSRAQAEAAARGVSIDSGSGP